MLVAPQSVLASNRAQQDVCEELVVNGDFETTGAGWSLLPTEYLPRYVSDTTFADSGQALRLGAIDQLNVAATSMAEQTLTLPPQSELVLSFYYYPVYSGTPTGGDIQTVEIVDRDNGERLLTILTSQLNAAAWLPARYSLSIFAGRTIRLRFLVANDGSQGGDGLMAMYVDQVSMLACPPEIRPAFPADLTQVATPIPTPDATLAETEAATVVVTPTESTAVTATETPAIAATSTLSPTATESPTATPTLPSPTPTRTPAPTSTPTLTPTPAPPPLDDPAACNCSADLYNCGDFPSWSAAQACFNHCRSTAGFDVHHLDDDGDNLACELSLEIDADSVITTAALMDAADLSVELSPVVTASTVATVTGAITSPVPSAGEAESASAIDQAPATGGATAQSQPATGADDERGVAVIIRTRMQELGISPLWLAGCIVLLVSVMLIGAVAAFFIRSRRRRALKAQFQPSEASQQPSHPSQEPEVVDLEKAP